MRSFIEKQHGYSQAPVEPRKYPPRHKCDLNANKDQYTITNAELQKLAQTSEANANNNNIFNGRNISDNTKVTSFYALKAQPPYQSPLLYFGQTQPVQAAREEAKLQVPESSMVKELFTGNVAMDVCENCKPKAAAPSKVSNLVTQPEINSKYDDAWYLKHNPQVWNNLRTLGPLKDLTKIDEDPIMRLNPTLYKVVENKRDPSNFTDPFQTIMAQQGRWIDNNQHNAFIKDMVYRSDLDHPNSMHNNTTDQKMSVQFPKTADLQKTEPAFTLNGYYDKEPATLKNGFKRHTNKDVQPVDERMLDDQNSFNFSHKNNVYQPNEALLSEISRAQKMREYERTRR